ncbi:MAG: hypothetical protein IPL50_19345 [Chitinophagaceae bacterium]|nr:hypothetical protein [Chitinophagaceae bacterium]
MDIDGLGDYQLRVTDVNNCTNSSNIITIKDSVSGKCFIYPNPTSGKFQVRYYSVANNVLPRTLTIYDAKGDRGCSHSTTPSEGHTTGWMWICVLTVKACTGLRSVT